jgi:hypothetical protein
MDLNQFNEQEAPSLSDFSEGGKTPVGVNKATASSKASYTAVLDGKSATVGDTYEEVKSDLMSMGTSPKADQVSSEISQSSLIADQNALVDMVADSSISFEAKKAAAYSVIDRLNGKPNLRNELSQKALSEDSPNENAEMETVRINTGSIIQEVNQVKREKQALLNSALAQSNPTTQEAIVDFFETLVPFTSTKRLSTLVSDFRKEESLTARSKTFADMAFLTGSDKQELINSLRKMSPQDQLSASQALVDAINNSEELLLPDENDLDRMDFLRTFLEDGYYTTADEWIDNVVSLLDISILAAPLGRAVRGVKTLTRPTSVAENLKDTNPGKARATHALANSDESGEMAEAAYGTSREDAIGSDLGFEIDEGGDVVNKVGNIGQDLDAAITPDPAIMDVVKSDGAIYYWEDEKRQARSAVYNDFRNPTGLRLRNEMQAVGVGVDNGAIIRAIYGPTDGGFASAQDAMEVTKSALRKYGIEDSNIELMMQRGDKYSPVPQELMKSVLEGKLRPVGGFLTKVNYNYTINPLDVMEWSKADVKWNLFDRIAGSATKSQGSLQQNLLDAHSMLHPNITFGAAVAVDKAAGLEKNLLELGKSFTDRYSSLPKDRQSLIQDYILEANDKGVEFNRNRLIADGYGEDEIAALKDWKTYWDTHYSLENRDLAKTLTNNGFKILEDGASDTRLFAKPLPKQVLTGSIDVYDTATDTVRKVSKQELDELYANKGTVARLRDPVNKDGDIAKYILSKEDSSSYLRGISRDEQVLNYRHGYYSVQYTAPKYVVTRVKDKSGAVQYERTVGMAGNTRDADLMARRIAATKGTKYDNVDPKSDVFIRDNVKGLRIDSDDYWTLQTVGGRSAQRIRGQRLEDASGVNTIGQQEWVMGPVDSLIHSARNIARRVPMRDYLEATKTRFVDQYKNVLPTDEFGQPMYPKTRADIGQAGRKDTKEAADARTTFEYIRSLEDGYINGIDEAYKATLKFIGNILGNASTKSKGIAGKALSKAEGGLESLASGQGPTGFGKNIAFQAYLAASPFRQALIQSHQSILLNAINPGFMIKRSFKQLTAMSSYLVAEPLVGKAKALAAAGKIAGMDAKSFDRMRSAWERSGMGSAVDKQNLIRGSLSDLATYGKYGATKTAAQKIASPLTGTLHLSRRVGFDTGEYINSLTSWLAYHDKIKAGKKGEMTQADYDLVTAKARNIALNMNQAGEMPYNQNSLGLFFQFMQVPHKMLTLVTFNRGLTAGEKVKLAGLNFLLFGVGGEALYSMFSSILPEDPDVRDAVSNGLEGFVVNTMLSEAFKEDTRIDFTSLAPTDMYGISSFFTSLWTENPGDILAASPAGQLFFGNNPKITNSFKKAAQYFQLMDDSGDPVELSTVFQSFAQISSGYSAGYKARMAYVYGLKRNAYGGIVDQRVSKAEAVAQAFGFATLDERDLYLTGTKSYESSQAFEEDFKKWYKDLKSRVVASGVNPEEREFTMRMMNAGLNAFEGDRPKFQQLLLQQLKYDVEVDKDYSLYRSAIRASGFMDNDERKKFLQALPFEDEEVKQQLMQILDFRIEEDEE